MDQEMLDHKLKMNNFIKKCKINYKKKKLSEKIQNNISSKKNRKLFNQKIIKKPSCQITNSLKHNKVKMKK